MDSSNPDSHLTDPNSGESQTFPQQGPPPAGPPPLGRPPLGPPPMEPPPMEQPPSGPTPDRNRGSVVKGMAIGFGALFAVAFGAGLLAGITNSEAVLVLLMPLLGVGIVQAAWVAPLVIRLRKRGETETAKGLLILAGIIFLLNAACWGLLATMPLDFK